MNIIQEFKAFALKGNVVDMAVGIIIGAKFGDIVSSLVKDVLMPPIGLLIGGVDFTGFKIVLRDEIHGEAISLNYGNWLQSVFTFLIVAFAVFALVKAMNILKRRHEESLPPPPPTLQESLLIEIRDLLRTKHKFTQVHNRGH